MVTMLIGGEYDGYEIAVPLRGRPHPRRYVHATKNGYRVSVRDNPDKGETRYELRTIKSTVGPSGEYECTWNVYVESSESPDARDVVSRLIGAGIPPFETTVLLEDGSTELPIKLLH